ATVEKLGVKILTDTVIGKSITLDELLEEEGFEAVFVASGAGLPNFQKIPGENLLGVYSANEFLTRINLMRAYDFPQHATPIKVGRVAAVIGGGNVAMDAARCAKRMGAETVYIVYRRSDAELPARAEEVHHAKEEGILFRLLTNPTQIIGDEQGRVKAMEVVEMELGEPDASGRRRPVKKPGSEYTMDVDTVIVAIGNSPNPLIKATTPGLECQCWGGIVADEETGKTSREAVYAGGDAVTGAATVILAMGAGKKAAAAIHAYIQNKEN
ncbi:MAG: FAD-dependent oxidoreductase, partial [Bacillota bacterium]|nr:FAD-dependent oxidoreductase [Bacillota bacterium]